MCPIKSEAAQTGCARGRILNFNYKPHEHATKPHTALSRQPHRHVLRASECASVCVCEYACVRVGGALNRKPSLAVKEHFIRLIKTTNSIEQQ